MEDVVTRLNLAMGGRYELTKKVGQGSMAVVYLAQDLKHHRTVALKVLRPELAAALGTDRFLAEIRVTANLQHPNILPLFDSGEAGGFLFYVMPYVEGESLRDRLDRDHQLSVEETVEIARSVATALDSAHRHGVIHRDIKPANILLHEGQALVADVGFKAAESQPLFSIPPDFLAPAVSIPYDLTPDGERFIMVRRVESDEPAQPPDVILVENWQKEVEEKVRETGG